MHGDVIKAATYIQMESEAHHARWVVVEGVAGLDQAPAVQDVLQDS